MTVEPRFFAPSIIHTADISPCGKYRYLLTRQWDPSKPMLGWVMLNPSTADAEKDDPTLRRVISFSNAWGGCVVANLFAFRATQPKKLLTAWNPLGLRYADAWLTLIKTCPRVVAAWGDARGIVLAGAERFIRFYDHNAPGQLWCLGLTSRKHPRHPLRLPKHAALRPFTRSYECEN